MNWSAIAASAMLMPPEAEPVMPASAVTVTASFKADWGSPRARCDDKEAWQRRDHAAEAVFGGGVHRRRSEPATAAFVPSANRFFTVLKAKTQHGQDADQQGALDRPDRRDGGDLRDERLRHPRKRDLVRGAVILWRSER